jgi:hypothetical protein
VPALSRVYDALGLRNILFQLHYFRFCGWSTTVTGDVQR